MTTLRMLPLMLAASTIACGGYSAPTTPTGGDQNPAPPGAVVVTIQDFSFVPQTVTIKAGTVVHWSNNGPSVHTTTSDTGVWDSGSLAGSGGGGGGGGGGYNGAAAAGGAFNFTFSQPGTYGYHCTNHPPSMFPNFTGTITVTP